MNFFFVNFSFMNFIFIFFFRYASSTSLKNHIIATHENDPVDNMYQCGKCQHSFLNMKKLAQHISKAHEAPKKTEVCHLCGETLMSASMKLHLKKVHETVKFECEYCGKEFKSEEILSKHIAKTCEVLPRQSEKCDICGITVSIKIISNFTNFLKILVKFQFHEFSSSSLNLGNPFKKPQKKSP